MPRFFSVHGTKICLNIEFFQLLCNCAVMQYCHRFSFLFCRWNKNNRFDGFVCFFFYSWNLFHRGLDASLFVLKFSIVHSLYERGIIRLVGRNHITRHKIIIYSKSCINLHLINTLLYYPIKPHRYQNILHLIKPAWVPFNLFPFMNKIGLSIPY